MNSRNPSTLSSCLLTEKQVAAKVGVAPTNTSAALPGHRRAAYFLFPRLLAIFQLLDPIHIPNSFANLQCVWWKAISGNDRNSSLWDGGLAYDLLPPISRWVVAPPLAPFYPRFHHANVELRTKYLDKAMESIVQHVKAQNSNHNIRLVLLGCGYDLRSLRMAQRFLSTGITFDLIEMDLPAVLEAKTKLFQTRLLKRRPNLTELVNSVRMFEVDLKDLQQVKTALDKALQRDDYNLFTVFVFEAVLIYLADDIRSQLLSTLSEALNERQVNGALCFADTLANVAGGNEEEVKQELKQNGWDLQDWIPKPGKTRHLGWATLASQRT
jgi:O-methyltransferase involved in polyketide biosynthesis